MTTLVSTSHTTGEYLTTPVGEQPIFTPELLSDEQQMIAQTGLSFIAGQVVPRREAIEQQQTIEGQPILRVLLEQAGELGMLMADIPEAYGGLEAGLTVSTMLSDVLAADASFSASLGAQTTIGSLPIVYFGTEEQKARYLPGLATGALVSAYCLTEPGAGSDAMAIKTRASLDAGGEHYVLNGGKQWITNAGFADMLIVFAKIDDSKFTAFIVESAWPGSVWARRKRRWALRAHLPAPSILMACGFPKPMCWVR